jgi:hypothetical protein
MSETPEYKFHKALSAGLTRNSESLPEGIVISDGMRNYDMRKAICEDIGIGSEPGFLRKALSTTLATYSAGTLPVLIPVYVDPELVDLSRRSTPLVELIPRVVNFGKTADYNQITSIATAQALAEDAALTEQNDSYVRRSVSLKNLYSVGRVTGQMFAASKQFLSGGGYIDALSLEVKNKSLAMKRLEEAMILLGNSQADWTEPVNSAVISGANSFDGLWQLISNANSNGLGGNAAYTLDKAGAALALANMRTGVRSCRTNGGEPNLIVCDYATYDDVKALIQDQLRYVSTSTIAWGITVISFEGLPIVASRFLSTTAGNGSKTPYDGKSMFILDTNVIEMRVLQDVTFEELAKTNDSTKFLLKCYEALVVKAPQFNFVIHDIL